MSVFTVLLAGGTGSRMNSPVNKVLMDLCGKPVLIRSLEALIPFSDEIIIVSRPEEQDAIHSCIHRFQLDFPFRFTAGGKTRQESVHHGLLSLEADPEDIVLIHDAARCLVDSDLIMRVIRSVQEYETGIPALPVTNTIKVCNPDSYVIHTPVRSGLYEIQTPQGFKAGTVIQCSLQAADDRIECTDDAGLLEHSHIPVRIVAGSRNNIKLTTPEDITRATMILHGGSSRMRIGMGYDVHCLTENRKLILCGEEIPFDRGLLGHSDADVAVHALMDAMLGACALGDIGKLFPDSDNRYSGISSMILLKETNAVLHREGYQVFNLDITIVAQCPKLQPFIPKMRENIASVLGLELNQVSIKATTTEKLGFEGRMEGISSYAVCSVVSL